MTVENAAPTSVHPPALSMAVDPEHGMLRLIVILSFIISGVASYVLINTLFGESVPFMSLISIALAVLIAMMVTRAIEGGLKRRWPSGRKFEVTGEKILLRTGESVTREIDGAQHVNVLTWRFAITKRTRVPKGWFVVALALMQEDAYLPVYTFMSPEDFEAMPHSDQFTMLAPAKETEKASLRLAGQQRRLRTAEYARWNEGAEMSKDDFIAALTTLQASFPMWMFSE